MHDYLKRSVDNLVEGLRLLRDQDNDLIAREVVPHLHVPTAYPSLMAYPGGLRISDDAGEPYDHQTCTVALRYVIGKVGEQFEGRLLDRLWTIQPAIANHINAHPSLVFVDTQDHIPELRSDQTRCTQVSRLGIIRDDPAHIGMEYSVTLVFHIENEGVWIPDD